MCENMNIYHTGIKQKVSQSDCANLTNINNTSKTKQSSIPESMNNQATSHLVLGKGDATNTELMKDRSRKRTQHNEQSLNKSMEKDDGRNAHDVCYATSCK